MPGKPPKKADSGYTAYRLKRGEYSREYIARVKADPERHRRFLESRRRMKRESVARKNAAEPGWQYRYQRERKLKSKYGLTRQAYEALLDAHGRACAICGGKDRLHVDHSHEDGHVRGILCGRCNPALGLLGDNIAGLERALRYLQERC